LNEGHGIQAARHKEVVRKNKIEKAKKTVKRGFKATRKAVFGLGAAYISDQAFNEGRGTKAVVSVLEGIGRSAVSAYHKSQGATNVRWM